MTHPVRLPVAECDQRLDLGIFTQMGANGAIVVDLCQSSDLEVVEWVNTFIASLKTVICGTLPKRRIASAAVSSYARWSIGCYGSVPEQNPAGNYCCASAWSGRADFWR